MAWKDMCYPTDEGGLGITSLSDINKALHAKLWWNFRTYTLSLWASYMGNKYCKKLHPVLAKSIGVSQAWRSMLKIREKVESFIWWQIKSGNSSFWFDNWTRLGPLYYSEAVLAREEEVQAKEYVNDQEWNIYPGYVLAKMQELIVQNIRSPM